MCLSFNVLVFFYGFSQEMLMQVLDEHCLLENQKPHEDKDSAFDFLYLPMDFRYSITRYYILASGSSSLHYLFIYLYMCV